MVGGCAMGIPGFHEGLGQLDVDFGEGVGGFGPAGVGAGSAMVWRGHRDWERVGLRD